nr:diguanylate cyclase [uncultured Sphaerochaeta sp.]
MRKAKKPLSIKSMLIILFTTIVLVSLSGIGTIIYLRWSSSTRKTIESIADTISDSLRYQIETFIETPSQVNLTSQALLEHEVIDLVDSHQRDDFFTSVLSSFQGPLYSFSYGTTEGYYYGARRNEQGQVEIMQRDEATLGKSWYFALNEEGERGEMVLEAGPFDPRTRPWYQAAVQAGKPVLSPVYKHFVMDDLAISSAVPVVTAQGELRGVLGAHVLLTDIAASLVQAVQPTGGQAVVVERETGLIIANSFGRDSFEIAADGMFMRRHISSLAHTVFPQAYESAQLSLIKDEHNATFHVTREHLDTLGVDWLVIIAIPDTLLFSPVQESMTVTILLTLLAVAISALIYQFFIDRLLNQVDDLLKVSESLASGDLSKRVAIVREDEIGGISASLNHVADAMQLLINNLEQQVEERTEALHQANRSLEENSLQLELLLNSTAEAIYGVDLEERCTFCNQSTLQILGYSSPDDLLGRNMHQIIHHSRPDGTPLPIQECKIAQSMRQGIGLASEDEMFWKADGTSFNASYHSFPQIREGKVVGGVVSFMDITQRKEREQRIVYLGNHDALTGLYNRSYFEKVYLSYDKGSSWPLSIIFADINGLKMTNDIFGHQAGDKLIIKAAQILKQSSRADDIVARTGGDEFILLLPKTSEEQALEVMETIRTGFANARIEAIKCSISLGSETKYTEGLALEEVIANAENAMYRDKSTNRRSVQNDLINTLQETLHSRSPREEAHSLEVQRLCLRLASALHLSKADLDLVKRVAYLHDIGKISLTEELLHKQQLNSDEYERMKQHPVVGYRILTLFDDTLDLAEIVYSHHERWDGSGYPRGLHGEQIPYLSRILAVAETYDRILSRRTDLEMLGRKAYALEEVRKGSCTQFDPEIATRFVRMIEEAGESGGGDA